MPISIQQISYIHPDKEYYSVTLTLPSVKGQKLGLVGNNGCGKSTLLQIIAGQLPPLPASSSDRTTSIIFPNISGNMIR